MAGIREIAEGIFDKADLDLVKDYEKLTLPKCR
jgi:hypothetical protein